MPSDAPFAEPEKQKNSKSQRAFAAEQTVAVPAIGLILDTCVEIWEWE